MPVFVASASEKVLVVDSSLAGIPGCLVAGFATRGANVGCPVDERSGLFSSVPLAVGTTGPGDPSESLLRWAWAIAINPKAITVPNADIRRRRRFIDRVPLTD
jgi:hypothetical protein